LPDPRSLRFGFGLGLCLIAVTLAWLAWPTNEACGPELEALDAEQREAPIAVDRSDAAAGQAERTESAPARQPESLPASRGTEEKARVQIVDGRTAIPVAELDVDARSQWGGLAVACKTDQNGYLELPGSLRAGTWKLSLIEPASEFDALQPERVWLEAASTTVIRLMRPHAKLEIEVRGPTGLLVADATVNLARSADGRTSFYRRFWTDEQGRLSIPWPPSGVSTSGWRATAFHADEGSCAPVDMPATEQPTLAVLPLTSGTRLELQVTDSVHAPIPYLEVRLRSHALTQQAFVTQLSGSLDHLDQQGSRVWTQLPAGEYTLSMRSPVDVGWLSRNITLGAQTERIDWVIDLPQQPIALEGLLYEDGLKMFPAVHQFVEVRDGVTDELIAGTRTDAAGRFRLFGESSGEVALYTGLLDSTVAFPPHVHRFPAGKRDVVLCGSKQSIDEAVLRVTDRVSGSPIANARLLRSDSDFDVLAGVSDSQGILVGRIIRRHSYVLRAEGYVAQEMTGSQARRWSNIELDRDGND
jgi:hypothetical protein